MTTFTLTFKTDNAVFDDGARGATEIAKILKTVARHIDGEGVPPKRETRLVYDSNGNRIGTFGLR